MRKQMPNVFQSVGRQVGDDECQPPTQRTLRACWMVRVGKVLIYSEMQWRSHFEAISRKK